MHPRSPTPPVNAPPTDLERVLAELARLRDLLEDRVKPLLTVGEVAELVGRNEYTVRRWIKENRLAATRVSGTGPKGRLLIRREDLDRLLGGTSVPTSTSAAPR